MKFPMTFFHALYDCVSGELGGAFFCFDLHFRFCVCVYFDYIFVVVSYKTIIQYSFIDEMGRACSTYGIGEAYLWFWW